MASVRNQMENSVQGRKIIDSCKYTIHFCENQNLLNITNNIENAHKFVYIDIYSNMYIQ